MYVGILPTQQQVCWSTKWVKRPDCSFWAHINKLCHPESTKGVAPTVSNHGWSPSSLDWLTGVESKQKTGLCRVESISPVAILETLDFERRFQNSLILGFSFQRFITMSFSQYFRRFDYSLSFSFQWWPEEADMEWLPVRYCSMNNVTKNVTIRMMVRVIMWPYWQWPNDSAEWKNVWVVKQLFPSSSLDVTWFRHGGETGLVIIIFSSFFNLIIFHYHPNDLQVGWLVLAVCLALVSVGLRGIFSLLTLLFVAVVRYCQPSQK